MVDLFAVRAWPAAVTMDEAASNGVGVVQTLQSGKVMCKVSTRTGHTGEILRRTTNYKTIDGP